ncbi:MAG: hypothetical protein U0667_13785 [Chloroflexota bacterium]|jgi:hypothetical protein
MRPTQAGRLGAAVVVLLAVLLAACGGGQAATLVTYGRDWPDGFHEELTVQDDGKVTMRHGDTLERLTLTQDQLQLLRDALAGGIAMGDQGDSLVRTVTLATGTTHSPVLVEPGSAVEMLETLMTTHTLGGVQVQGATPPPMQSMGPMHSMAP